MRETGRQKRAVPASAFAREPSAPFSPTTGRQTEGGGLCTQSASITFILNLRKTLTVHDVEMLVRAAIQSELPSAQRFKLRGLE